MESYPSAEKQLVYSTALPPLDWAMYDLCYFISYPKDMIEYLLA